mmetsp:Transcript_53297/g.129489  ORF Transcript_53297/g.129489 Transcript_53297/m.129489 type:complete len:475 (+) Transcript_53297:291-1715(+)
MDDPKDDKEKKEDDKEEDEDPFWSLALQDPHEVAAMPVEGYKIDQDDSGSSSSGDGDGVQQQRQSSIIGLGGKFVKYQLPYISSSSSNASTAAAAAAATVSTTPIILELASLPMDDGIMGPVGGDAWYASALLTTMILRDFKGISSSRLPRQQEAGVDDDHEDQDTSKNHAESSSEAVANHTTTSSFGMLSPQLPQQNNYKVLELGSGAVALPGISCAVALEKIRWQKQTQTQKQKQQDQKDQDRISNREGDGNDEHDNDGNNGNGFSWQIHLTDNDSDVLDQLKRNVNHNMSKILPHREPEMNKETSLRSNPSSSSSSTSPVKVSHLDWDLSDEVAVMDDDDDDGNRNDDSNNSDNNNNNRKQRRSADTILDGVDLVIGSELVYTEITGRALLKILKQLLRRNSNVVIWIVQVIDRYGWTEIVLPGLEKDPCVKVESFDTIPIEIHQVASSLIPMGGTLDRYAFGAVCIKNVL